MTVEPPVSPKQNNCEIELYFKPPLSDHPYQAAVATFNWPSQREFSYN